MASWLVFKAQGLKVTQGSACKHENSRGCLFLFMLESARGAHEIAPSFKTFTQEIGTNSARIYIKSQLRFQEQFQERCTDTTRLQIQIQIQLLLYGSVAPFGGLTSTESGEQFVHPFLQQLNHRDQQQVQPSRTLRTQRQHPH